MSNVIATDVQTQEIDSALVILFELTLPNGTVMRFHPGVDEDLTNVQFRDRTANSSDEYVALTYSPMPMIMDGLDYQADGASTRPSVTVANIGTLFSSGLGDYTNDDLIGQRILRRQTLRKYLVGGSEDSGINSAPIEFRAQEYVIDRIASEDSIAIVFELAAPYDLENIQLPRRVVVGKYCSWQYQGHDTNRTGGCTWAKDSVVNYQGTNGTYSHNAYFDADDSPLITAEVAFAAYAAGTAYTEVDYVTHDSKYWQCIIAGTGNTPADNSSFWKEAFMWEEHANLTTYAIGDRVRYGVSGEQTIWKALRAHTSSASIVPERSGNSYWVREDVCGKTLNSCKSRYGFKPTGLTGADQKPNGSKNTAARLPFGSFPGTLKF
jgi:lambda family phage minor tail protein L